MTAKFIKNQGIKASSEKGFTLIELLVVIGILAILMGIVLIAINPARQFAQANNTDRTNAVTQILNAIGQYEADHHGQLPGTIPDLDAQGNGTIIGSALGQVDLCTPLVSQTAYMPAFPQDPNSNNGAQIPAASCGNYNSGYTVGKDATNRVTVAAPSAEIGASIKVTR